MNPFSRGLRLFCVALLLGCLETSFAIIRRDDVPDANYLSLGAQFPQLVRFELSASNKTSGILIASQWVVTAAHAKGWNNGNVTINGQTYKTAWWWIHPVNDICLTKLDRPVLDVVPMRLDTSLSEDPRQCYLAGYGATGTGLTGQTNNDFMLRAGTNIAEYDPFFPTNLWADFDDGTDANNSLNYLGSSKAPTSMECSVGNGDSGGALITMDSNGPLLAGIISSASTRLYGAESTFVRLADQSIINWITTTMGTSASVYANAKLLNFLSSPDTIPISFEFHSPGSPDPVAQFSANSDVNGLVLLKTSLRGTYDVYLKPRHFLRKMVTVTIDSTGSANCGTINFTNGDIDDNNIVNINDYARLNDAMNATSGSSNYDADADLDGNGIVNISDYAIMSDSFGQYGP